MIMPRQMPLDFDGKTYSRKRDGERLAKQLVSVSSLMTDGKWRSLSEIAEATGAPMQSVSARLRDLRKEKFGSHTIESKYVRKGLWIYRMIKD